MVLKANKPIQINANYRRTEKLLESGEIDVGGTEYTAGDNITIENGVISAEGINAVVVNGKLVSGSTTTYPTYTYKGEILDTWTKIYNALNECHMIKFEDCLVTCPYFTNNISSNTATFVGFDWFYIGGGGGIRVIRISISTYTLALSASASTMTIVPFTPYTEAGVLCTIKNGYGATWDTRRYIPDFSASDAGKVLSIDSEGNLIWITPQ